MSMVGNDGQPLHGRANYVYNNGIWLPLLSDANGALQVLLASGAYVPARGYGYIGGGWQANPLQLGVSAVLSKEVVNSSASAGTNTLTSSTVPSGELWVLNNIVATDINNAITESLIEFVVGGLALRVARTVAPAAGIWGYWNGFTLLAEGDYFTGIFVGCTAGDALYVRANGYRIDIDIS